MTVDANHIMNAVLGMGLRGDETTGLLRKFGVILAINSVDYLVDRELEFLRKYPNALEMVETSLIDAAQWCDVATFGGMMKSPEWEAVCSPMINSKRDQLEALHAIQNCMGWGKISSYHFDEANKSYEVIVEHSYYVDNYLRHYGVSDRPRCYMWTGVAAGNMDLLLGEHVHDYEATEVMCAAKGDPYCKFVVKKVEQLFDLL
ncbi:MAG: V4R domain-containing protein [Myxococcota bacterium]|jgi:predicted hydrocarbon binding protein|nr:V4R domain-containing protein [Myxococcota bacterium]